MNKRLKENLIAAAGITLSSSFFIVPTVTYSEVARDVRQGLECSLGMARAKGSYTEEVSAYQRTMMVNIRQNFLRESTSSTERYMKNISYVVGAFVYFLYDAGSTRKMDDPICKQYIHAVNVD